MITITDKNVKKVITLLQKAAGNEKTQGCLRGIKRDSEISGMIYYYATDGHVVLGFGISESSQSEFFVKSYLDKFNYADEETGIYYSTADALREVKGSQYPNIRKLFPRDYDHSVIEGELPYIPTYDSRILLLVGKWFELLEGVKEYGFFPSFSTNAVKGPRVMIRNNVFALIMPLKMEQISSVNLKKETYARKYARFLGIKPDSIGKPIKDSAILDT